LESSEPLTFSPQVRRGGRTALTTQRIHEAVIQLLIEGGHDACTFQNVARRAGIERSTLYRRYPSRWAMLGEAYAAQYAGELAVEPSDSFAADLKSHLTKVADILNAPLGIAMVAAAAVARTDPEARKVAGRFWQFRLKEQEGFVAAAIRRGELPSAIDREALFAAADGPLYFRMLVVGAPIDEQLIDRVVADVLAIHGVKQGSDSETAS